MKKYYLNDGTSQQGPFDLEELKSKNITAETPVWYDGLPEWTTAGKLDELKALFIHVPPPFTSPEPPPSFQEVIPVTPVSAEPVVTTTAATTSATATAIAAKPAAKKNTKWISWVATVLVLGAAGYFVYQDMEKNKGAAGNTAQTEVINDSTATTSLSESQSSTADTAATTVTTTTADTAAVTPTLPATTTPTITTTTTTTTTTAPQTAAQKTAAKKAEDEKKKQLALKKAADDKKKLEAAQAAAAARQMEMRNHWAKYISFGNLSYQTKGDGIKAFDVPVYNGTDAMLDKVTVRIEYTKKNDKKIVKTETITLYNIPAKGGLNGKAPESKKGDKVNLFITGVTSGKLHFCYPQNNGNPADPYFCN